MISMRGGFFYGTMAHQGRKPAGRRLLCAGLQKRVAADPGGVDHMPCKHGAAERPPAAGRGRGSAHTPAFGLLGGTERRRSDHRLPESVLLQHPPQSDGGDALLGDLYGGPSGPLRGGKAVPARRMSAGQAAHRPASGRPAEDGGGDRRGQGRDLLPGRGAEGRGDCAALPQRGGHGEHYAGRLRRPGRDRHPRRGPGAGDCRPAGLSESHGRGRPGRGHGHGDRREPVAGEAYRLPHHPRSDRGLHHRLRRRLYRRKC